MKHYFSGWLVSVLATVVFAATAQERPYSNVIQELEFGELTGFIGSCRLDYATKILSDNGGSLCPFSDVRYGEPAKYLIVANFNTDVQIMISSRANNGDGISYTPSGVYRVQGENDIPIIPDQNQVITSSNTGVITIILGGTITVSSMQALASSYSISVEQGITFNEVP